jgi:hypothetical protein
MSRQGSRRNKGTSTAETITGWPNGCAMGIGGMINAAGSPAPCNAPMPKELAFLNSFAVRYTYPDAYAVAQ